jgi:hypothetical protein
VFAAAGIVCRGFFHVPALPWVGNQTRQCRST